MTSPLSLPDSNLLLTGNQRVAPFAPQSNDIHAQKVVVCRFGTPLRRTCMKYFGFLLAALAVAAFSMPAAAHHSFAAEYDAANPPR